MKRLFLEHFRCPASYVDFRLSDDLNGTPGFFRCGPDVICYGRLASGRTQCDPATPMENAFSRMKVEKNTSYLPFDLDEVAENLRYERYLPRDRSCHHSSPRSIVRTTYYALRPFLSTPVRRLLQRFALRGWDETAFPVWPIDQTVDRLFNRMMSLVIHANSNQRVPFIWFWPGEFSSCALVTHDVETQAGRDFCPTLMDLDDSFDIKSSFQVVPEGRYEVTEEFLDSLRQRGFEINVHDFNHDGDLFKDREEFLRRVARINAYGKKYRALGYRSGVLYRNLDWYDSFDYAYDMSVPNVGHLDPQPGGCCTIRPYFIGNILEIPVVATQDYTLFHILRQYSTDLWERQIAMIAEANGLISFIVHPDYLIDTHARDVYAALLDRLSRTRRDFNMWIPLPRELNDWWRARHDMRLVNDNGTWKIEGSQKERARIAYASLEDDRVVYSFDPEPLPVVQAEPSPVLPEELPVVHNDNQKTQPVKVLS